MSGVFSGQSLHDIGTGSLVSQKPGNFGLLVCLQTSLTWILRIWILFLMLGVQLFLPSELFLFLSTFLFKDIKSNISIPVEVSLEASGVRSPWTWVTVICEPPRVVWKNSELVSTLNQATSPGLSSAFKTEFMLVLKSASGEKLAGALVHSSSCWFGGMVAFVPFHVFLWPQIFTLFIRILEIHHRFWDVQFLILEAAMSSVGAIVAWW